MLLFVANSNDNPVGLTEMENMEKNKMLINGLFYK